MSSCAKLSSALLGTHWVCTQLAALRKCLAVKRKHPAAEVSAHCTTTSPCRCLSEHGAVEPLQQSAPGHCAQPAELSERGISVLTCSLGPMCVCSTPVPGGWTLTLHQSGDPPLASLTGCLFVTASQLPKPNIQEFYILVPICFSVYYYVPSSLLGKLL